MGGRSQSSNSSTSNVTNENTQMSFDDIDGIAVGEGNISIVDGGAIESNRLITHDALNTSRTIATTALDFVDDIAESFLEARTRDNAADAQAIGQLIDSTRSDGAEAFGNASKLIAGGLVFTGVVILFTVFK